MRWSERTVAGEAALRPRTGPPTWALIAFGCLAVPGCLLEGSRFTWRSSGDDASAMLPTTIALVLAALVASRIASAAFVGQRDFVQRLGLAILAGSLSFVGVFASAFLLACATLGATGTRATGFTGVLYDFIFPCMLGSVPLAVVQQILLSTRYPEPERWRLSLLVLLAWGGGAVNTMTLSWMTT